MLESSPYLLSYSPDFSWKPMGLIYNLLKEHGSDINDPSQYLP